MHITKFIPRVAGMIEHALKDTHRAAFLTLTYRDGETWAPKQITEFLNHVRKWYRTRVQNSSPSLIWVAEMHSNRAYPHYHLIIWLPKGHKIPKPDESGWWSHGMSNIRWARSPAGYLAKYLGKARDYSGQEFPQRMRRYGIATKQFCLDFFRVPSWLTYVSRGSFSDAYRRIKGWGWHHIKTGIVYSSPYVWRKNGPSCERLVKEYRIEEINTCWLPLSWWSEVRIKWRDEFGGIGICHEGETIENFSF